MEDLAALPLPLGFGIGRWRTLPAASMGPVHRLLVEYLPAAPDGHRFFSVTLGHGHLTAANKSEWQAAHYDMPGSCDSYHIHGWMPLINSAEQADAEHRALIRRGVSLLEREAEGPEADQLVSDIQEHMSAGMSRGAKLVAMLLPLITPGMRDQLPSDVLPESLTAMRVFLAMH